MKQRLNIEETTYETKIHTDCIEQFRKDKDNEYADDEDYDEYTQCIY